MSAVQIYKQLHVAESDLTYHTALAMLHDGKKLKRPKPNPHTAKVEELKALVADLTAKLPAAEVHFAPPLHGFIYVVQFQNYVKIGFTRSVARRIANMQTGFPEKLSLLASFNGWETDEASLHRRFSHLRAQGEWFRLEGAVKDWVEGGCPYER